VRAPHRLVVVGARGWRDAEVAKRLRAERVLATGRIPDDALVALLRGAEALVHPSWHEGFGFPVLEAMACGAPVVAAPAPSVAEIAGDAAVLVDVEDEAAFAAALDDLLGDATRRGDLRERGLRRAAELSWERCAERMAAAYRQALDG
jgi:glycosyltransferase involved in cell wall biosynthesis